MRPTIEELRAALDYDPDTGALTWATTRRNATAGMPVSICPRGRCTILFWKFKASSLIWFLAHGERPGRIEPVDGDPRNLRLTNWRQVRPPPPFLGVHENGAGGWRSTVHLGGGDCWKSRTYRTAVEAKAAREGFMAGRAV